jgi:hypothetical protein
MNKKYTDKKREAIEIDFTELILQAKADKKAGYPPKCNEGYEVSGDGKTCVLVEESEAKKGKKENPFKKKDGDKKDGDKKDGDKKDGDKKDGDKKNGEKKKPFWMKSDHKEGEYPGKDVERREDGVPKKKKKKRECKKGEYRDKSGNLKKK